MFLLSDDVDDGRRGPQTTRAIIMNQKQRIDRYSAAINVQKVQKKVTPHAEEGTGVERRVLEQGFRGQKKSEARGGHGG